MSIFRDKNIYYFCLLQKNYSFLKENCPENQKIDRKNGKIKQIYNLILFHFLIKNKINKCSFVLMLYCLNYIHAIKFKKNMKIRRLSKFEIQILYERNNFLF